ncbi:MAG: DMT family transporter [Desulfovibrio sp.]|jgi:drug/metabolite transporter (DMT)-like permease|nr:DMT family transporter [Desulfovibrio sp.]
METSVILVVLGSAVLHAVWNAIIKGGSDKLVETSMKAAGGGLAALLVLPFLPPPLPESRIYLCATVFCHFFYYLFISLAYRNADMSYAYTIMRGSAPLFTALASVLALGEAISTGGWAGVLLLSFGVLVLAGDAARRGAFSLQATFFALANAFVIMGYSLVDGHGVRLSGHTLTYICWAFFCNAFPITVFALATRRGDYVRYVRKRWRCGLCGGLCSAAAYGLALWGMTRAPVALVAALRETSVVFGVVFAVIFLKEKITPARITAVVLVLAGAIAMRV